LIRGVVYVAHVYGERPSKILGELMETEFTPEESILIDYESLKYISELNSGSSLDEDSMGQRQYLEQKWKYEDMKTKREMERRKKEYENILNKRGK